MAHHSRSKQGSMRLWNGEIRMVIKKTLTMIIALSRL